MVALPTVPQTRPVPIPHVPAHLAVTSKSPGHSLIVPCLNPGDVVVCTSLILPTPLKSPVLNSIAAKPLRGESSSLSPKDGLGNAAPQSEAHGVIVPGNGGVEQLVGTTTGSLTTTVTFLVRESPGVSPEHVNVKT